MRTVLKLVQLTSLLPLSKKVRLDNIRAIIERVVRSLEKNPQLLGNIVTSVTKGIANVLSSVTSSLGTVVQVVDQVGNIVQKLLNSAGQVCARRFQFQCIVIAGSD